MRRKPSTRGVDRTRGVERQVAELACRQHGVVARRQLIEAGLSGSMVERRLSQGRLHQLHRGVYLVGHAVPPPHAREMAALLACGDPAVLSHRTAAAIWDIFPYPATADVWVTVPPERRLIRPRIRVHRAALNRRDIRRRHNLALTSPPRTILDLAAVLDDEDLERLVAEAQYRRLATELELRRQLASYPGKRGSQRLRRVLDLRGGPRRTRSPAERRMLRLLRHSAIGGYETNARIHGYEVDILWRERDFVVEIDGYESHGGRIAFERDRLKIAKLKAHGLGVMPITPRQLRDDPAGVLARLVAALEQAGRTRKP